MLVKFSKFNLDLDPPGFQDVYEDELATVPNIGDLVFVDGAGIGNNGNELLVTARTFHSFPKSNQVDFVRLTCR